MSVVFRYPELTALRSVRQSETELSTLSVVELVADKAKLRVCFALKQAAVRLESVESVCIN